jgi:hypothetical protein
MNPIITKVAGVSFGNCQQNIKFYCYSTFIYDLTREFDNPYDPNAVRVSYGPFEMGYLPTGLAQKVAPLMDAGTELIAEHVSVNECPPHKTIGLTIRIVEVMK